MNALCDTPIKNESRFSTAPVEVRRLDPLADPEWDRLVASHPDAGPFHRAAWARVLVRTYGHRPLYLACHQAGRLTALIPLMEVRSAITGRRGVCVPFADFCGPLFFADGTPSVVMEALSSLARERGWRYFEIRGGPRPEPSASAAASFLAHSLDLRGGPDKLFAGFDSSVRRALRKGSAGTLRLRSARTGKRSSPSTGFIPARVGGTVCHRSRWPSFSIFTRKLSRPASARWSWRSDGSKPVAASIFFHYGTQALYKFGASDERLQATRANNLVMWTGIRILAEQGYRITSFRPDLERQ